MLVSVTKDGKTLSADFPCLGEQGTVDDIFDANGEDAVNYAIEKMALTKCKGKLSQSQDMTQAERNKMAKEFRLTKPRTAFDRTIEKIDALSDDEAERLLAALQARGKAPKPAAAAA